MYESQYELPDKWSLRKLESADVERAADLCDRSVGKNLYPKAYLESIITNPLHYFYVLKTENGDLAGYIYFILMDYKALSEYSGLAAQKLRQKYEEIKTDQRSLEDCGPIIANLRSIGVDETYRNMGLSRKLFHFQMDQLVEIGTQLAIVFCWKPSGGVISTKHMLMEYEMEYLTDVPRLWYNQKDLVCPICKGRCKCDAEVYYKKLSK